MPRIAFENIHSSNMKTILYVLSFFSVLLVNAQQVTVGCRFSSTLTDSCSLRIDKYHIQEYEPMYKSSITEQTCTFKPAIDKPCLAELTVGKQLVRLCLEPNDDQPMQIGNDISSSSITAEGKGAVHTNFLLSFYTKFGKAFDRDSIKKNILSTVIDPFENSIFNAREKQLEFLISHFTILVTKRSNHMIGFCYHKPASSPDARRTIPIPKPSAICLRIV